MNIILEWTDGIWKTSVASYLKEKWLWVGDRSLEYISKYIVLDKDEKDILKQVVHHIRSELVDDILVILYTEDESIIRSRLSKRWFQDDFDKDALQYNDIYKNLAQGLKKEKIENFLFLDIQGKTVEEIGDEVEDFYHKKK